MLYPFDNLRHSIKSSSIILDSISSNSIKWGYTADDITFCFRTFENRTAKAASFLAFCVCRIPNGKCYQIRSFISLKGLSTRSKGKEDLKSVSFSDLKKILNRQLYFKMVEIAMPNKFVILY
jgi:hypothetical protein